MFSDMQQIMIEEQIINRHIHDQRVIAAMEKVPRKLFVPEALQELAYQDSPLPIGYGQTISQPFIVAFMLSAAQLMPQERVLEIGTGSGYEAAILSLLCREVYTIEILEPLGEDAQKKLKDLGYTNVQVKIGNGYEGWPEAAPFDAIIVTAAPEAVPHTLIEQLSEGGRLIVPVGTRSQALERITRTSQGLTQERLLPVKFVPMVQE